jgi:hypothetical protein
MFQQLRLPALSPEPIAMSEKEEEANQGITNDKSKKGPAVM